MTIVLRRKFVLFILLLTACSVAWCGDCRIDRHMFMLSNLNTDNGLSSSRIYSVLEASDGAMWFSSKSGIDRFNGHEVKNYYLSTENKFSDASGRMIRLVKDFNNNIFAYDNKGKIFVYDSRLDEFILKYNLDNVIKGGVILNDVYIDRNGVLWVALNRGLFKMSPRSTNSWIMRGVYANHVNSIGDRLIIGTTTGVYIYNFAHHQNKMLIKSLSVQSSFFDNKTHYLWLGTFHEGVKVFDIHDMRLVHMPALAKVPKTPVRSIELMNANTMLLGIDGAGIYAASRDGADSWLLFDSDDKTGSALHGNGIYDICKDRFGDIWICSYSGGIDMAIPIGKVMEIIQHEYLNQQSLLNNSVNDVLQLPDGNVWYATDRGVSLYNKSTHKWLHTLYDKVALTLCRGAGDKVLVGTYGNGVYSVAENGTSRQVYSTLNGTLKTDYVYSLLTDRDGDLWIGCLDGPLVHIGRHGTDYYPIQVVQCITEMPDGRIAIGTANGFYTVDKRSRKDKLYFTSKEFPQKDINYYIQSMLFTGGGEVWLATDGGGIYIYNMLTHKITNINTKNGLPSNTVYSLCFDKLGRVLVSTDLGLALVFTKHREVVNINFLKGLEREYKRMSMASLIDGRVIFGSSSGAVILDPLQIDRLTYRAPLNFTRVRLLGQNYDNSAESRMHMYTMLKDGKIEVAYNQNALEFDFESINFKYQHDIVYKYMLEGFDNEWSQPSSEQKAHYTNLPPGHYILHVKSFSRNDGRILGSRNLMITVNQPWWNTWYSWVFYTFILATTVYFGWNLYHDRLQRRYFDEKINFFVHTAHDIRTPLSLVLAPLGDIAADNNLSDESRKFLEIARNNGKKLLNMITQLLDFQKSDRSESPLYINKVDLRVLLEAQIDKFRLIANQKHIDFSLVSCPQSLFVWLDVSMADKIFENLLSNAFKYTHEGDKIKIEVWDDDNYIHIKVSDTGIGIPKYAQKHIFQNFYRADNAINSKETGSGLGLMLTKRLVCKLKGKLTFESMEGSGTSFFLTFRKGYNHFSKSVSKIEPQTETNNIIVAPETIDEEHTTKLSADKDTILFVDDNDELRRYIRISFSGYYNIVDVPSAEDALLYMKDGLCDIVISDIMMPGMKGDELCKIIKENENMSWLPVILLTAKSGRNFMIEGLGLGADDYITKPFDTVILRSKIDSMLQNRRRLSRYYLKNSVEMARTADTTKVPDSETALPQQINKYDREFVDKATRIVLDNISDTDFSIDKLCSEMAMSRTLFYGKLKSLTSQPPQDFIRLIKLERAATLIRQGETVLDVSVMTGFINSKYFSTVFKKHFGVSPSKYK